MSTKPIQIRKFPTYSGLRTQRKIPYVTRRWTSRERRRVTVPAAATPARRISSPGMMSANPRIQFVDVGCAGTSSANNRKGTGSQLRVRNNTAPMRALARCSAADGGGESVLGDSEVDIG